MKPHLIIKLKKPVGQQVRYWEDILTDKASVPTSVSPAIDHLIQKTYALPYWLTANYRPRGESWSADEIKNGFNRIYRLILQQQSAIPESLVDRLRLLPEIEYVYPGRITSTTLPASRFSSSASLTRRYRNNNIFLQEAHLFTKGIPEVKIAILDTGFDTDHPELAGALLPGKDFVDILNGAPKFIGDFLGIDDVPDDSVGHGTHVAGIIAGRGLNMPLGVSPNCKILPVKVLGALKRGEKIVGAGLIDNINNGIKWAVDQGADVINMSLGIKHQAGGLPHEEVIEYALKNGVTVVAASGNDGTNDLYYPGALPGVIAVGATDDHGNMAHFSTFGGHVSLVAPGVNIYSTHLKNGYAVSSGTSQAAPFVTGAIALLKSHAKAKGRQLKDGQIKHLLKHSSDKLTSRFKDFKSGFGRINLLDAMKYLEYKF